MHFVTSPSDIKQFTPVIFSRTTFLYGDDAGFVGATGVAVANVDDDATGVEASGEELEDIRGETFRRGDLLLARDFVMEFTGRSGKVNNLLSDDTVELVSLDKSTWLTSG